MEGIPARIMERMIRLGIASNRTEAIRLAFLDYEEHHKVLEGKKFESNDEEEFYSRVTAESNQDIWDNEQDEKMVQWYLERLKDERKKK
jgi:hypothetical protein